MTDKLLHINSYFFSNGLHWELIKKLAERKIEQSVFIPLDIKADIRSPEKIENTTFYIAGCFNKVDRYLWPLKIYKIWREFNTCYQDNAKKYTIVHAHSLFVNGTVAYLIKLKYEIPYIVTVRNSDINTFFKKSFVFRQWGFFIMRNAEKVTTLSKKYFSIHLRNYLSEKKFETLKKKHLVIFNGAADFWFENKFVKPNKNEKAKILFVGLLGRNKNLESVMKACEKLFSNGLNLELTVVGDGPLADKFKKKKQDYPITFTGYVKERNELAKHYRSADVLVVPSFTESFGIVYVEAMTQSLPVIYSRNQGFDGFYEDGLFGFGVVPTNINEISEKIQLILDDYPRFSHNAYIYADHFKWIKPVECLLKTYNLKKIT